MENLNAQTLFELLLQMKTKGFNLSEVSIVLGDDEELNGVHEGYFCNAINVSEKSVEQQVFHMEDFAKVTSTKQKVALLIS